jgi:hypothetical protein
MGISHFGGRRFLTPAFEVRQVRRALLELLSHAQVLLEMRQRLRRPALELRIIPALGIGFEQGNPILVALDLGLIVALVEVLAALRFQVIEQLLVFRIQCGRQLCLHLAAVDQGLQLAGGLLMIGDHLLRERLGVGICLLGESDLARLHFEHVADRDFVHELLGGRRLGAGGDSAESDGRQRPAATIEILFMGHLLLRIDGSSAVQPGNVPPSCRFRAINRFRMSEGLACRREISRRASRGAAVSLLAAIILIVIASVAILGATSGWALISAVS